MISKQTKIYIAGHKGMVGSAVWRKLESKGYTNLIGETSKKLDLRNQQSVFEFYKKEQPEDWVIATGKTTTVRDFVKTAFSEVGIELEFKGTGDQEKAFVSRCSNDEFQLEIGKEVLSIDPNYYRPTEVDFLVGDPSKAKEKLGWVAEHDLASLVKDMMKSDINLMKKDQYLKTGGYKHSSNLE